MGQESEKKHRKIYLLLIMLLLVAGILLGILYFQSSQEIEKSQKEEKSRKNGKKLGQLDTNYKNQILHLLVDEFSYALNETPEAARKRLYEAVSVLV